MKFTLVVGLAAVLAISAAASAQTLGDVARQEEARRKTVKTPSKVYTNDNLKADTSSPPPPAAATAGAQTPSTPDASQPAAAPADTQGNDEASWKKRMADARDALDRAKTFADALQTRINSLTNDFTARDDPAQRAKIASDRDKALAELDRVQKEITGRHQGDRRHPGRGSQGGRACRLGPLTTPSFPVLLVEDKDSLRAMLRHALEAQGHLVIEARDEPEAIQQMRQARPAVVLTDLKLPDGDGFGVLRAAKELDPELPVVVMTAYGSIQDAVTAMKEGAMDFLAKPVDPDHLLLMVERAIAQRRMLTDYFLLKQELAERRGAPRIIGDDPKLRQVSQQLHRAAGTDATVLLEGESGTGKELFARALHALSPRADGPFVAINCAAIPETLLETELFGHEKGAFTGASARKPGGSSSRIGGTLFLDEIGELPLGLQAKILRALEEKSFERVGGTVTLHVDVRVVAATNRQPEGRGRGAAVPRGSLLPPVGVSHHHPAAARADGRHRRRWRGTSSRSSAAI